MKLKPLFLALALLVAAQGFTQETDNLRIGGEGTDGVYSSLKPQMYNPMQSKVPVWLDFSVGADFAHCADKATIPFRYKGIGANAKGGVTIEWGSCRVNVEGSGFYTSFTSFSGTAYDINLSAEFLYRCTVVKRWSFWAGSTLQGFMDIKEIPALMNATSSVSSFGNLCATGMVEYPFAFNSDNTHHWLTASGKLNLPFLGAVNRPGYAYIGNPTINEDAWLGDNETFAKFFPGVSTELGLYLNLCNDNRIGLSYRWDYLTTGKIRAYRYDNALHSINLSFMFRVN
jgi:hypothetical protein